MISHSIPDALQTSRLAWMFDWCMDLLGKKMKFLIVPIKLLWKFPVSFNLFYLLPFTKTVIKNDELHIRDLLTVSNFVVKLNFKTLTMTTNYFQKCSLNKNSFNVQTEMKQGQYSIFSWLERELWTFNAHTSNYSSLITFNSSSADILLWVLSSYPNYQEEEEETMTLTENRYGLLIRW